MKTLREMMDLVESAQAGVAEGQVNELDKKTLGSYVKKATDSMDTHAYHAYRHQDDSDYDKKEKRKQGINKAVDRLTKGSIQANKGRLGPKGVLPEEQVEESTPDALAKIDNLFRK